MARGGKRAAHRWVRCAVAGETMDFVNQPQSGDTSRPEDHGLSLEALTAGLAEMLSSGQDPYARAPSPEAVVTGDSPAAATSDPGPEITPRSIVEAMLFVGHPQNEPLTSQQIAGLMRGVHPTEIDELVRDLNDQYARDNCPYKIDGQGAGYHLVLREEYSSVRERLAGRVREARLSQAAIEVLALVAYNESITGEEVSRIRGRASGAILAQLVRRQLLKVERTEGKPRRAHYSTTGRFLQLFGLESLADLPRSQDIEER
jgi:segregation and condensation protein B